MAIHFIDGMAIEKDAVRPGGAPSYKISYIPTAAENLLSSGVMMKPNEPTRITQ